MANNMTISPRNDLKSIAGILVGFSLLCFVTAFWFNGSTGMLVQKQVTPKASIKIGPFSVKQSNAVLSIKLAQKMSYVNQWSNVACDVQDSASKALFSFREEFFKHYEENSEGDDVLKHKQSTTMKTVIKRPGNYYLTITQGESKGPLNPINVTVSGKTGSYIPHQMMGILCLLCGVGLLIMDAYNRSGSQFSNTLRAMGGTYE